MRFSASSRAVSIRIGTPEAERMPRTRSKPVSPGIMTSRISRSKLSPPSLALASAAVSAVVTRYPSASRKRSKRSRMRRSSSTTKRCGAVSDRAESARTMVSNDLSPAQAAVAIGPRDQIKHRFAMPAIDHRCEKPSPRVMAAGGFRQRAEDALRLQPRQPHREGLALRRDEEQTLAPIVLARLLNHITLLDQLAKHAAERLFGNAQQLEQLGNLHARIAVDEMHNSVMRAAEAEFGQDLVGIADEVAIREKKEFNDIPDGFTGLPRFAGFRLGGSARGERIYVSHIDIFRFDCYQWQCFRERIVRVPARRPRTPAQSRARTYREFRADAKRPGRP